MSLIVDVKNIYIEFLNFSYKLIVLKISDEIPISPTTSSTSTKRHPSQSEEDIDKLVAMHQRHSSLGVSEMMKLITCFLFFLA